MIKQYHYLKILSFEFVNCDLTIKWNTVLYAYNENFIYVTPSVSINLKLSLLKSRKLISLVPKPVIKIDIKYEMISTFCMLRCSSLPWFSQYEYLVNPKP